MSDYMPTTEVVKDAACWQRRRLGEPRGVDPEGFDRWLAKVKAEAQVEVLRVFRRELIEHQFEFYGGIRPDVHEVVDDLAASADGIAHALGIDSKGGSK